MLALIISYLNLQPEREYRIVRRFTIAVSVLIMSNLNIFHRLIKPILLVQYISQLDGSIADCFRIMGHLFDIVVIDED